MKWALIVKGGSYTLAALLTPLAAIMAEFAQRDQWPSAIIVTSAALTGLVQAIIATRAYLDGSAERGK
jgi:hypothetical protein